MLEGTRLVRSQARNLISLTKEFWNENPCDGQRNYALRSRFRYRKDPWLLILLQQIASRYHNVLEVGCGQGTDGITLCRLLENGSQYTGVDLSEVSLTSARAAASEMEGQLRVASVFQVENAERLNFPDNHFDCVLSVGALHHSPNTEKAIAEIKRVLAPGGSAFVCLYRIYSPKVLAAHALRAAQRCLDRVFRTDRVLYRAVRRLPMNDSLGTAVYECFGVPILRSYSRRRIRLLFSGFTSLRLSSHGTAFPCALVRQSRSSPFGYLWLAVARK